MTQARLWQPMALSCIAGILAALGLAPYGLWPFTLAGLVALGVLLSAQRGARAGWIGWAFGLGYFAHALAWLVEPFLVDAATHGWMIPFAISGMAGGLAVFWALAARLGAGSIWATAVLLSLAELARGYIFTGFPWGGLAQIWIDTPVAQSLAVIGPYGLGALTALSTLPLGSAFAARRGVSPALMPGAVLVLLSFWPAPQITMTEKLIRIVQPNAEQHLKWDPNWVPVFYERHLALSSAGPAPDLVVWSENALPWTLNWDKVPLDEIAARLAVPLVTGIQRVADGGIYNSAILIGRDGAVQATYDKHHLVPFGEYMPVPGLFRSLGIRGLAERADYGYSAGSGPTLIDLPGIGPALPLICYEAVFPQDARAADRPAVLLALTNDAWFGTRSGPYQHLVQARMRAIEQGLPMIRAANTGVSAVIDPVGGILAQIPLGQSGAVDTTLPAALPPTLYARTGDLLVLALLAFLTLVSALVRLRAVSR